MVLYTLQVLLVIAILLAFKNLGISMATAFILLY